MAGHILRIAEDFWNIRGSFRIAGVIDVGTQASLVKRRNGKFVFLDTYTLSGAVKREINELTGEGRKVEAIINLHPFHTIHVKRMHAMFPHASLYGTARHLSRMPGLPWETVRTEDPEFHDLFADDFDFSVPRGVDFISADENVHFASVLALHRASSTIHVDDTVMFIRLPGLMHWFGLKDAVSFHPTLARALEKRPGAARDFRQWASELIENWGHAENLCAAHTASLLGRDNKGEPIQARLTGALAKAGKTLDSHERKFG
jgi:hypothetical protein